MSESGWSVRAIADDRAHGSAFLSLRALELLEARAASEERTWSDLAELARELVSVRPSMAVIANRVHRTMHAAGGDVDRVGPEAQASIERASKADGAAAAHAAELVRARRLFTLSRSETVTEALVEARPPWIGVAESLPGGEGRDVVETLQEAGLEAMLYPDAAMVAAITASGVEVALVGADAVFSSGAVVNKVGTYLLALAAREHGVPMYAVCAEDKIATDESLEIDRELFEVTPARMFAGIVTENGVEPPSALGGIAQRLASYRDWMKS